MFETAMLDFSATFCDCSAKKYNVLSATLRILTNLIFHQINLICWLDQIYLILSLSVAVYLWQDRTSSTQLRAAIARKALLILSSHQPPSAAPLPSPAPAHFPSLWWVLCKQPTSLNATSAFFA